MSGLREIQLRSWLINQLLVDYAPSCKEMVRLLARDRSKGMKINDADTSHPDRRKTTFL